jgi:hypothetical protein
VVGPCQRAAQPLMRRIGVAFDDQNMSHVWTRTDLLKSFKTARP